MQPLFLLTLWISFLFSGPPIYLLDDVDLEAAQRARAVLNSMVANRPEYKLFLALDGVKMVIYNEDKTDFNEVLQEFCPDEKKSGDAYGRYCPTSKTIIVWQGDLFRHWGCGQFTVHEIAHALEHQIMIARYPEFEDSLISAFETAIANGTWSGYYAMGSKGEFWATGVMSYFGVGWDEKKKVQIGESELPPGLRDLIDEFFNYLEWSATCPD